MKFYLDTANPDEIAEFLPTSLVDGITTNPILISRTGKSREKAVADILKVVNADPNLLTTLSTKVLEPRTEFPISVEVLSTSFESMVAEGKELHAIDPKKIVVKIPLTHDGLKACHSLARENISVNFTLCFSSAQALIAAKSGASFVSPFVGRLDDVSSDAGMRLTEEIVGLYQECGFFTEILVASIRYPLQVIRAAKIGADAATMPVKVLRQLVQHPLTDKGLDEFRKAPQFGVIAA